MRKIHSLTLFVCSMTLAACGDDPAPATDPGAPASPDPTASYQAGLQNEGSVALPASPDRHERIDISAPITPRTDVIYPAEYAYPKDLAGEAALGHAASLPFGFLLTECAKLVSGITLPPRGAG